MLRVRRSVLVGGAIGFVVAFSAAAALFSTVFAFGHSSGVPLLAKDDHRSNSAALVVSEVGVPPARAAVASKNPSGCVSTLKQWTGPAGNRQMNRSSHDEDLLTYDRFFGLNQLLNQGVYLEMGAFDGVAETNTALYQNCLGWQGVLIEASPTNFAKLRENRPLAYKLNVAASCEDYTSITFYDSMWTSSSIFDEGGKPVSVRCAPLTDILMAINKAHINFFSLDVEGAELITLQTLDFSKIHVDVFLIESENRLCSRTGDGPGCESRDGVRALLAKHGFKLLKAFVPKSDVFVHPTLAPKFEPSWA